MCIICAKPAGVMMPTTETRSIMWKKNPDGAGLMWVEDGRVKIAKGFMQYEAFERYLEKLSGKIDMVKTPIVMHFRITTHGGTKPENCHPFPITENLGLLQKLESSIDIGVAHNGVLSITPRTGISDTMEYILTQLSVIKKINRKFYREKKFLELISNATVGSRLCFLTANGEIVTTGNYIKEENGLLYSNSNYKDYPLSFGMYGDWGGWTATKYATGKNEKLICCAEDVGVDILIDGMPVDDFSLCDWYIDVQNNVYEYDYECDYFVRFPSAKVKKRKNGTGWTYRDAILVEVSPHDILIPIDYEDEIPKVEHDIKKYKCDICETEMTKNEIGYDDDDVCLCRKCAELYGYTFDGYDSWDYSGWKVK